MTESNTEREAAALYEKIQALIESSQDKSEGPEKVTILTEEEVKFLKKELMMSKLYPDSIENLVKIDAKYPGALMSIARVVGFFREMGWFGNNVMAFTFKIFVVVGAAATVWTNFGRWVLMQIGLGDIGSG